MGHQETLRSRVGEKKSRPGQNWLAKQTVMSEKFWLSEYPKDKIKEWRPRIWEKFLCIYREYESFVKRNVRFEGTY